MSSWSDIYLPDIVGTLPSWISASGILTLVGILLRNQQVNRKLQNESQGLIGQHMGVELASLRDQIIKIGEHHLEREREIDDRWRQLLAESEARHAECQRQREELGQKVGALSEELTGTKRQFIHFQQRFIDLAPAEMREALRGITPFAELPKEDETATLKSAKTTERAAMATVHKIEDAERSK